MDILTPAQCYTMGLATAVGSRYHIPELAAMVLTESSAGVDLIGDDSTSFGPVQMTITVAREVLAKHPEHWPGKHTNMQLRRRLLRDPLWAMTMAAQHMLDLRLDTKHPLRAYNAGRTGALRGNGDAYEQRVLSRKWTCPHANAKKHKTK